MGGSPPFTYYFEADGYCRVVDILVAAEVEFVVGEDCGAAGAVRQDVAAFVQEAAVE